MNKKKYLKPLVKQVEFNAEAGFATSGMGFVKTNASSDFVSDFSIEPLDDDGKYNGKYNDRFNETNIDALW